MDNVVTIDNTKEQTLEFDISVQGLSTEDIRVWFGISANGMDICFPCVREDGRGDKWSAKVPVLPFLDRTAYPCTVSIVADGYYFEPLHGTLNVTGPAQVYSTAPKNVTIAPANRQDDKKDDEIVVTTEAKRTPYKRPAEMHTHKSGRSIAQIAKDLTEAATKDPKNTDKKDAASKAQSIVEKKGTDAEKKSGIDKILENLGAKLNKTKKSVEDIDVDKIIAGIDKKSEAKKAEPLVEKKKDEPVKKAEVKKDEPVKKAEVKKTEPLVEKKKDVPVKKDTDVKAILEDLEKNPPKKTVAKKTAKKKTAAKKAPFKKITEEDKAREAAAVIEAVEQNAKPDEKQEAVMAILEDLGAKPKGAPETPRVSFIKKETHQK